MRWRWVPREEPGPLSGVWVGTISIVVAISASSILVAMTGAPPLDVLWELVRAPLSTAFGLSETLLTATPLLLCGLAVAFANQGGLWNIGAEGQLLMGAFAAGGVALHLDLGTAMSSDLSPLWAVPLATLAAAAAGATWALLATTWSQYTRMSEILSTLMLNYVAIAWLNFLLFGPWKGADGFPYTEYIADSWRLPVLYRRVHLGLLLALSLVAALYLFSRVSALGYEMRIVGASRATARYAGMSVGRIQILVMAISGAVAGLAGAFDVMGVSHRLHTSLSLGYGYTAIIIAFLARAQLLLVPVVAVAFAALMVGGESVQIDYPQISAAAVAALQGILLIAVLVGRGLYRYRLVRIPPPSSS